MTKDGKIQQSGWRWVETPLEPGALVRTQRYAHLCPDGTEQARIEVDEWGNIVCPNCGAVYEEPEE